MAIVGLLDFKTDASFSFDTVDNFLEKCRSINLLINAKKTKEMILSFSRPFAIIIICLSIVINCLNSKLRSRFYAFSKF